MPIEFNWYLPTHGDGRHLLNSSSAIHKDGAKPIQWNTGFRAATPDYLAQVAQAAEAAGFHAVLIPTGSSCHDSWLIAAGLARETRRLSFLVAFRPGAVLPAVAAQSVQTLHELTGGRLLLNVVTGGSESEQKAYGDFLDHDQRYERTDEFLAIVRSVWGGRTGTGIDYQGRHYRLQGGGLLRPLRDPPAIYFGGSSAIAEQVAAQHADVYLQWGEPPEQFTANIRRVRERAAATGRTLRYGYRVHVIARDSEEQAWAEAERLLREVPRDAIERSQAQLAASQSVGQARMRALHQGRTVTNVRDLEISPNLWAGIGLVRGGAGTAIVGSHRQVAERFEEYHALGIDSFILSGYPNLEEAIRVGEEVLPLVSGAVRAQHERQPTELRVAVS
jgi:alkanesulfonate monooxygenase